MERKRKLVGIISVFVVVIILSSTTVMPAVNKNAVENIQEFPMTNEEILQYCYDILDNPLTEQKFQQAEQQMNNLCNIIITDDDKRQSVKEFLNLDTLFNISEIRERLSNTTLPNIYENLNKEQTFKKLVDMLTDEYIESGEYHWTMFPLVTLACNLLGVLSLIWFIPITILFGEVGLIISLCITLILFSAITFPFACYVGTMLMFLENPDIEKEFNEILGLYGLVGFICFGWLWCLEKLEETGYYEKGLKWVFDSLLCKNLLDIWDFESGSGATSND